MKKIYIQILLLTSFLLAETQTVAISYFDNTSGLEEYNPLSKGLADMLITDLSNVKSIQIVEREKLESLLKEIELGEGNFMDESTAQKLGKGLGAGYMLTGSYFIMGNTMRIDARLVNVGTGEVSMGEEITGEKDAFFELEKKLVNKLIDTFDISLSKAEARKVKKVQTESFQSFNAYSSALVELDKGNVEKSIQFLEIATEADENFDQAWDKLEILEQQLSDLLKARDLGLDLELINIIERISNKEKESFADLVLICSSLMTTLPYGEFLTFYVDNNIYQENLYLIHSDSLLYEVEIQNNKFQSKISKALIFYSTVIDIMISNGLINEPYYTMKMEELMYYYYVYMLDYTQTIYIGGSENSIGIPDVYPDIIDSNGIIIQKGKDINKTIIKISTKMMENYQTGIYFTAFENYYKQALSREKKIRNN